MFLCIYLFRCTRIHIIVIIFAYALKNSVYILCFYVFIYLDVKEYNVNVYFLFYNLQVI